MDENKTGENKNTLSDNEKMALCHGASSIIAKALGHDKANVAQIVWERGTERQGDQIVPSEGTLLTVKVGYCKHEYIGGKCKRCESYEPKEVAKPDEEANG